MKNLVSLLLFVLVTISGLRAEKIKFKAITKKELNVDKCDFYPEAKAVILEKKGEIDFVATKPEKKIYIQVAYSIPNEDTKQREFGAYEVISDNYPKYVITLDRLNYEYNGIKHVNLIEFLLDENF